MGTTSADVAVVEPPGEARPSGFEKYSADFTAVAKSVGEVQHRGIAENWATTESELARPSSEDRSSESV